MRKKTLFIHIGFPKTGSTMIQRRLFKFHPQLNSLVDNKEFAKHIYALQSSSKSSYLREDLMKKNLIDYFSNDKINIISSEGLTDFAVLSTKKNLLNPIEQCIQDLIAIFSSLNFEIKFLVFIREQASAIISKFSEHYDMFVSRIDPEFSDTSKFVDILFKDSPLNNYLRNFYDYKRTLLALKKTGCEFKFFKFENYNENIFTLALKLSRFLKIDPVYTIFLLLDERMRVSPKVNKYEYYASKFSDDDHKLDHGKSLATDLGLNFFNKPEFKQNDFHIFKIINYYRLFRFRNSKLKFQRYEYKNVDTKKLDKKFKHIKFSKNDVIKIKNYYRESNVFVDLDQKLNLKKSLYYN